MELDIATNDWLLFLNQANISQVDDFSWKSYSKLTFRPVDTLELPEYCTSIIFEIQTKNVYLALSNLIFIALSVESN